MSEPKDQEKSYTLTTEQVAERLGLKRRTVQKMVKDGRIPGRQFGRATRVCPIDLAEVLRDHHPEYQRNRAERFAADLGRDIEDAIRRAGITDKKLLAATVDLIQMRVEIKAEQLLGGSRRRG